MNPIKSSILTFCVCIAYLIAPTYTQRMFSVTGTGEVKTAPDEAVISIGVELRHRDLGEVNRETDERASAIITVLRENNIEDKDIQTSFVTLTPIYEYSENDTVKTTPDYYSANKAISFVLKNISNYDKIMFGLYGAGINRIDSVSFRVSDLEDQKFKARELAIENAKKIADTLTTGFGARTGRINTMSESFGDYNPVPPIYSPDVYAAAGGGASSSPESSSGPSISGGEVVLTCTVSATFYIIT